MAQLSLVEQGAGTIPTLVIIWALLWSPAVPLAWQWSQPVRRNSGRPALVLISTSYAWLFVAAITPSIQTFLLGPDYSYARTFAIPSVHVVVVLAATAYLVIRGAQQIASVSAGVLTVLCWIYVALVGYAV